MRAEPEGWHAKQPQNMTGTNSCKVVLGEAKEGFLNRPDWFGRKRADYFLVSGSPKAATLPGHISLQCS